ncbi:hypothetical protein H4R26_004869, partial [Coemansia thaxteri]
MTEQATAAAAGALESSDKQKKILAAKKKLKSFQAKRAATTAPEGVSDDKGAGAADAQAVSPGSAAPKEDEADVLSGELEQLKLQINAQREQLRAENRATRAELQESNAKAAALERD